MGQLWQVIVIIIRIKRHLMDELLQLLLGQVVQLHLQPERLLCNWLVRRVVVLEIFKLLNWYIRGIVTPVRDRDVRERPRQQSSCEG